MASWAAIAKTDPSSGGDSQEIIKAGHQNVVVVDANAIINGVRLEAIAQVAVTIPEVLAEVRDKQARQFLQTLPFGISTREPSEDSTKSILRFARETGDVHSLSANDIKLLALAHTLEVEAHGSAHLREHPMQARIKSKSRTRAKALPGWGSVPNPEDWAAIDEVPDTPVTASSRIQEPAASTLDGGAFAGDTSYAGSNMDDEDGSGDDGGWETAAKSKNAARHRKRKEHRKMAWLQSQQQQQPPPPQQEEGQTEQCAQLQPQQHQEGTLARQQGGSEAAASGGTQQQQDGQQTSPSPISTADEPIVAHTQEEKGSSVLASFPLSGELLEEEGEGQHSGQGAGTSRSEGQQGDEGYYHGNIVGMEGAEGVEGGEGHEQGDEAEGQDEDESSDGDNYGDLPDGEEETGQREVESTVAVLTADFAMQNVAVQMGLRLVAGTGARITRLTRWALRCGACSFISREAGRLFCSRCGNMTMERVEVVVGGDGAEYFGVRKMHVLRGTKFSLPKPKSGRGANNPILREDEFKMKCGKKMRRKQAAAAADPFAPEFTEETWHSTLPGGAKNGLAPHVTSWKNNPNERHNARTNRRK